MRKLLCLAVLILLVPLSALANQNAQGWCEVGAQPVVTSGLTSTTQVQQSFPACTVTVFVHGAGLATIFSDNNGTPLANPFTASANGRWEFYSANGRYDIQLSGAGFPSPVTYSDVVLQDAANQQAALPNTTLSFSATPAFNVTNNVSYTMTLTGNVTSSTTTGTPANGNLLSLTLVEDATGSRSFAFPSNFIFPLGYTFDTVPLHTNALTFKFDGTNWNLISNSGSSGGGGSSAQGPLGTVQTSNGAGVLAVSAINDNGSQISVAEDTHFKGLNPWIDVTAYGARPVNAAATPAAVGLTANCTGTQPTVTISSASTFQNGDGVVVYGCGASQSMTTPSAPVVTPSLPNSATGIGGLGFIVNGLTGATTYNYQIVARDKNGGLTAASTVGSTTTGASSLGTQSVSITSLTRASSGLVTVVTSSAHGLVAGAMVHVSGTSNPSDFDGWAVVASSADNTHFTFTNGVMTVEFATGGTATWWNANHLSWTAVTGAWEYYIYGRTGGSLTLVGVSKPSGTYTDNTWDDYGSPMMDGVTLPPFVPSTPPGSATSDHLSTTIVSGAGTTTLTLANNAGTTVSGATIRYDAAPNIATAAAATGGLAPLYFPAASNLSYVINSYLDLTANNLSIVQVGQLTLNETMALGAGVKWYGDRIPPKGSPPSFGFQGNATINVLTANPGIYIPNGGSTLFQALQFSSFANASQQMVIDGGNQVTLNDMSFQSGGGSGDYMGVGLNFRSGGLGNNAFEIYLNRILLVATQGVATATPMLICDRCGTTQIGSVQVSARSMFFTVSETGQSIVNMDFGYDQAGVMPFFMVANRGGLSGFYAFKHVNLDTMPNALFSFTGPTSGAPGLTLSQFGRPTGSIGVVTGVPLTSLVTDSTGSLGQNTNLMVISGATISAISSGTGGNLRSGIQVSGALGMGYAFPMPAAPTVVVGAHSSCSSNCVAAGTYFYYISANDVNGAYSLSSAASSAATTDGTQTITVSWTILNGQVSTNIGRSTLSTGGVFASLGGGGGTLGTSFVDSSGVFYSISAPTVNAGNSEGLSAQGFSGHQAILVDPVSSFSSTLKPTTLTANRTVTLPDASGTLPLGAPFTTNGILFGNGTSLIQATAASGTGTFCAVSTNGGVPAWGSCAGSAATAWSSLTNPSANLSLSMGTNTSLFTSGVLTGTASPWSFTDGNSTSTGSLFNLSTGASSTLHPFTATAQGSANGVQMGTNGVLAPIGTGGITANAWTPSLTANQLLVGNAGAISSLVGTLTGTNPVLTLTSAAVGNVPFALNTPASPTADLFDLNINSVKTAWFDNLAILHTPSATFVGSGPLVLSGTEGTCPSPASGIDIICVGNSATHSIQTSLNGTTFKDSTQWTNSNPIAHGVALVGIAFPQITSTSAGTSGQPLISGGASADPAYGTLGASGGGTGNATNTAHGVMVGEGTSPVALVGPNATSNQPLLSAGASADPAFGALPLGNASAVSGVLAIANGGTGASSLSGANIATVTGAITIGDCAKWSASTVITDAGAACGGGSAPARLDQITAATGSNTIANGINPQTWNWALTGSTTAFKFGETTAATGSSNIILQATTASGSTALPFQVDANGIGWNLSTAGLWQPKSTGTLVTPGTAHAVVISEGNSAANATVGPGITGQVLRATTSGDPVYIDLPDVKVIPAANCNNTTAGAGWSLPSGGTITCRAGTNNLGGFITITDTSTTFAQFMVAIPEDWDSNSNPFIRFGVASTDTTSGHTIIPQIKVSCSKGDGSTTDEVAFNAAHSLSTTTLNTTANQFWSSSNVQMNSTDMTGCVAGAMMIVQVGRATDTATNAEFYSATITFPRLIVVQAN